MQSVKLALCMRIKKPIHNKSLESKEKSFEYVDHIKPAQHIPCKQIILFNSKCRNPPKQELVGVFFSFRRCRPRHCLRWQEVSPPSTTSLNNLSPKLPSDPYTETTFKGYNINLPHFDLQFSPDGNF